LEIELHNKFNWFPDYVHAIKLLLEEIELNENFFFDKSTYQHYYSSLNVSFTFYCKCKLIFYNHLKKIIFFFGLFLYALYSILKILRNNKLANEAEKIYKKILCKIKTDKKVSLTRFKYPIS
jgi:hypothetical protein